MTYTKAEIDDLLSNKPSTLQPEIFDLPLGEGLLPRQRCYYYKHENGDTIIHGDIIASGCTIEVGLLIATLPKSFRPQNEHTVSATYVTKTHVYCPGVITISSNGGAGASMTAPHDAVNQVRFNAFYPATQ